jgi:hypothetical protein
MELSIYLVANSENPMLRLIFIFFLITSLASCSESKVPAEVKNGFSSVYNDVGQIWDKAMQSEYAYEDFEILILEYKDLPYVAFDDSLEAMAIYDDNGIPVHDYQAVALAQHGLNALDVFGVTHDSTLVVFVDSILDKLIGISLEREGAIFFPYSFDFALHGMAKETMMAPWVSGMAQGQILSLYCRMYEISAEERFLEKAHKVFYSFIPLKAEGANPWVSCVDRNGNLWLEEYPEEEPAFTLNGMNFAIYGVYDYYRITKSEAARRILQAALTTVKVNIEHFRREGDISSYCLKHDIQSEFYHTVHVEQLHDFYLITGDAYFEEMSTTFKNDFWP